MVSKNIDRPTDGALLTDIRNIITTARASVAATVNAQLTLLYWRVGQRIKEDVLSHQRADYGKEIVVTLSRQLSWSHFPALIPLGKTLQREFYAEMCRVEAWIVDSHLVQHQRCGEARTAPIVDSHPVQRQRCGSSVIAPYGVDAVIRENLVGLGYER